eukprot:TRINITY_DN11783_c0_g1_i2.p1 TRINITY_DN11783_c0_g1~~TRINITY_DN11783_c0_g1_i2.p1  ORF type:complete len:511 (+),score=85.40 TRINITY_DN11783_c0_g1_i2:51-1535(+)
MTESDSSPSKQSGYGGTPLNSLLRDAVRRTLFRPGEKHKSTPERLVTVARARIGDALCSPGLTPEIKALLQSAEETLRTAEQGLATARLRTVASQALTDLKELDHDASRNYVVENFTEADVAAAEGHDKIVNSPTSKRHSTMDFFKAVASIEALERVGNWDFDAVAFAALEDVRKQPISVLGQYLVSTRCHLADLQDQGVLEDPAKFMSKASDFLTELDSRYLPQATYHGNIHAADVMATIEWFFRLPSFKQCTTHLDHLMSVMAAAIHDVGHPGKNNMFQSKTMSELAVRYNDKSVLENFHVATAFGIMLGNEGMNWFGLLSESARQYLRKGLIGMVLATDMAKHAKHTKELKILVDTKKDVGSPAPEKQAALEQKLFLLDTVLHASDISNPCKPRKIMLEWTQRVLNEFWEQGAEEKRLGLPVSPLCDEESGRVDVPKGQMGFINFVIRPFWEPIAELIPDAKEAIDCLEANKAFWEEKETEKTQFDQIFSA